jgi:hypothetical protein
MPTLTGLQIAAQGALATAAQALQNRGVIVPGGNVIQRESSQVGWDEAHLFSDAAFSDYPTLASMLAYWQTVRVAIPIRATRRRIYFALWFDGLATARATGTLEFLRDGSTALAIPFDVTRNAATDAWTHGLSLPSFEVRRLAGTDTTSVVPAAATPGPDLLTVADYTATARYVTTLAPVWMHLAADSFRLQFSRWAIANDAAGTFSIHAACLSDAP